MKGLADGPMTEEKLLAGQPAKLRDVLAAARELAGRGEPPTSPKLAGLTGYAEDTIFRHRATLQGLGLWPDAVPGGVESAAEDDPPKAVAAPRPPAPRRGPDSRTAPSLDKPPVSSNGNAPDPLAAEFEAMRCLIRLDPPAVRRVMAWAAAYFCKDA